MKILKSNFTIAALVAVVALTWFSCKKEVSTQSTDNLSTQSASARFGGITPDDPAVVSRVPLIMSAKTLVAGRFASESISLAEKGKPGSGATGDVTPPAVSITSPANGTTVSGTVSISVSATDNVGVASVSLSVDGVTVSTLTASPYNFTWDASTIADGTHTLTATARDAKNNSGSYSITVSKNTPIIVVPPPTTLPGNYLLTTPPVGNQGNEFACVPFAVVYGARSMEQYYRKSASSYSYSSNIFSPEYVYDQTKVGDCGSGTAITSCLDFMYAKGVTTWATVPYSDINGCTLTPTSAQISEAANYKIPTYSKIQNVDRAMIKTMIYSKHPVIAGINIDFNFTNAAAGYTWNSIGTGNAPHCVVVVGYDDSKNAYRILNSWGTGWGDAGYLWVNYSVFEARSGYYLYTMNY